MSYNDNVDLDDIMETVNLMDGGIALPTKDLTVDEMLELQVKEAERVLDAVHI